MGKIYSIKSRNLILPERDCCEDYKINEDYKKIMNYSALFLGGLIGFIITSPFIKVENNERINLEDRFVESDLNGNGYLDKEEFEIFLKKINYKNR